MTASTWSAPRSSKGIDRPGRWRPTPRSLLVSGPANGQGAVERVVLVAMDAEHATAVAAASLRTALTVVFH